MRNFLFYKKVKGRVENKKKDTKLWKKIVDSWYMLLQFWLNMGYRFIDFTNAKETIL